MGMKGDKFPHATDAESRSPHPQGEMEIGCRTSMSGRDWLKFFKADLTFERKVLTALSQSTSTVLSGRKVVKAVPSPGSQAAAVIFAGQDLGPDLIRE